MGDTMIEITKSAIEKISDYFKDKEVKPIRIFLHAGGCATPSLAIDVGEPRVTDCAYDINGFKFVIDKDFLKEAKPIKVDYNMRSGFQFDSELEFEAGCSVCMSGDCG